MQRSDVTFDSGGQRCAAWLYRPDEAPGDIPCVVLGHGLTVVRDMRADAYAERFAAAGMAALVFDYRHFGSSEGEPRQLLDIKRQLADWKAAIAHARSLGGVDPDRIAIWGSSFGGGHVIETASREPRIAAAIAQVPYADGLRNLRFLGVGHSLKLTAAGLRDQLGALVGRPPYMVPAAGPPSSLAVMTTPDAEPGMRALASEDSTWVNALAARFLLRVASYRPLRRAGKITCPILFAIADDDAVTPPELALRAAEAAPRSEVVHHKCGHFDIYLGEIFEETVAKQVDFLRRHLLSAPESPAPPAMAAPVPRAVGE